jgi:hypothetical protein
LDPYPVEVSLDEACIGSAYKRKEGIKRHTEKKVMHWVDDDLLDYIEIRKT